VKRITLAVGTDLLALVPHDADGTSRPGQAFDIGPFER
jgi:hypothetical protein